VTVSASIAQGIGLGRLHLGLDIGQRRQHRRLSAGRPLRDRQRIDPAIGGGRLGEPHRGTLARRCRRDRAGQRGIAEDAVIGAEQAPRRLVHRPQAAVRGERDERHRGVIEHEAQPAQLGLFGEQGGAGRRRRERDHCRRISQ
jgi:hypothetical protein